MASIALERSLITGFEYSFKWYLFVQLVESVTEGELQEVNVHRLQRNLLSDQLMS